MEKDHRIHFIVPVILTELIGTCLFSMATNLSGPDMLTKPLAFFALIVCCFDVSGGHLNPAVTLGVYLVERNYKKHAVYLVFICGAQISGALLALLLGYMLRVNVVIDGTDE